MDVEGAHILLIEARFYDELADELALGATEAIEAEGATCDRIAVPGVLEIPTAMKFALMAMEEDDDDATVYDGVVALGCVIRGETSHYDIVSNESARGIMDLSIAYAMPLGNGILTVENDAQAWARANRSDKNKGRDAAVACMRMIELRRGFGLWS